MGHWQTKRTWIGRSWAARSAHRRTTPTTARPRTVTIAYSFLLENPECFILDENGEDQEWPADMPQEPPIELIAAYYEVETALDLCC